MTKKKNICSSCNEVYEGKITKEFMTGIKHFICPKCQLENRVPLGKVGYIINNIIMIIFGILSVIVLFDTNWLRGGLAGFMGSLVGNSIILLPFIFSLVSFLAHRKLSQSHNS